jgi:hypothetical protein
VTALLDHMGQFVCQQVTANRRGWGVLPLAEYKVVADGVSAGSNGPC